jgi:hypothetical protein
MGIVCPPSSTSPVDDDVLIEETQGYRLANVPSSIGMFSSAPLILLLNSAWSGVVMLSALMAFGGGIIVEGDPPAGGGVAGVVPVVPPPPFDCEFGSPFSLARIRISCCRRDSFSKVRPRFFSTDSTDARAISTRIADRLGMNRSLE